MSRYAPIHQASDETGVSVGRLVKLAKHGRIKMSRVETFGKSCNRHNRRAAGDRYVDVDSVYAYLRGQQVGPNQPTDPRERERRQFAAWLRVHG